MKPQILSKMGLRDVTFRERNYLEIIILTTIFARKYTFFAVCVTDEKSVFTFLAFKVTAFIFTKTIITTKVTVCKIFWNDFHFSVSVLSTTTRFTVVSIQ